MHRNYDMKKILFLLCIIGKMRFREAQSEQEFPFPADFKFGVTTSAFQIEGGWNISGKGQHIWDTVTHQNLTFIKDKQNGEKACDSYHLWKKDVELLNNLGVHFYRFSLSWSRLLPTGFSNHINLEAVQYYNSIINELLSFGIEPMVTLYHGDLPQPLQDMGGWPNPSLVPHYENYANVAFRLFGDRVKTWITFNDPYEVCVSGYGTGNYAPGIVSPGISDYLCGKTILLAHAKAYKLYKQHYYKKQKGEFNIITPLYLHITSDKSY
ncbi:myrosinase 1-like [Photinus pyralis]|uniref:myrosinase 1-like n=1 Tax=Photinus pyralis TaxID=7054 RepID=UPI0012672C95|nr:myrosinase 1-like [Photinus pyralis]